MDARTLQGYLDGYRNGRADRLLGLFLVVSLASTYPGYAEGYADGVYGNTPRA